MLRWITQMAHDWIHRTGVNGLIVLLMMLTLGFVLTTVWWRKNPSLLLINGEGRKIATDIDQGRSLFAVQRYLAAEQRHLAPLEDRNQKVRSEIIQQSLEPHRKSSRVVNNEEQKPLFNDLVEQFARFKGIAAAIDVIELSCRANVPSEVRLTDVGRRKESHGKGLQCNPNSERSGITR